VICNLFTDGDASRRVIRRRRARKLRARTIGRGTYTTA